LEEAFALEKIAPSGEEISVKIASDKDFDRHVMKSKVASVSLVTENKFFTLPPSGPLYTTVRDIIDMFAAQSTSAQTSEHRSTHRSCAADVLRLDSLKAEHLRVQMAQHSVYLIVSDPLGLSFITKRSNDTYETFYKLKFVRSLAEDIEFGLLDRSADCAHASLLVRMRH
jgi:C4-type Zn-finger protein